MGIFHPYDVLHIHSKPNHPMKRTWSNPAGLVSEKPIALRLMPDELSDAERIAKDIGVSKSRLARMAYLKGLPLVSATSTSADLSGGEAIASPSGLSSTPA